MSTVLLDALAVMSSSFYEADSIDQEIDEALLKRSEAVGEKLYDIKFSAGITLVKGSSDYELYSHKLTRRCIR
ncbi:MAG: hypothetical protein ACLT16_15895 [[Clostridium] innocuum]